MSGKRGSLGVVLALACALMLGAAVPAVAAGPVPVPLSKALDMLQSGAASSARVTSGDTGLELVLVAGGRRRSTLLPADLLPRTVAAARAGDVPLSVAPPQRSSPAAAAAPAHESDGGMDISGFVQTWAPLALLLGLVATSALALRAVTGSRFKRQVRPVQSDTTFADVAGIDEIRNEVSEIADVLGQQEHYRRVGAAMPRGIILHGPPGTGKTLLARAVAGEAGVPFFSASGSEFVEMYAGLGLTAGPRAVRRRPQGRPGGRLHRRDRRRGRAPHGHASSGEREQTLDQLLSEMDGFRNDPARPVVVLASTNRIDDLDPALVRAGRFDRRIAIGLPGRAARRAILDVHMRGRPLAPGTNSAAVASFTVGMAGADLAALCNEASFEAARSGRALPVDAPLPQGPHADHRRAGAQRPDPLRRGAPRRRLPRDGPRPGGAPSPHCDPVERVTVIPQGAALGVTISLPTEDRFLATRRECLERLGLLMAGRASEELVFGEFTSGAADDLRRAATLARGMAGDLVMAAETTTASLASELPGAPDGEGSERAEALARVLLQQAFQSATAILRTHRDLLDAGVERLLEAEELERDELGEIFGPRPEARRLAPQQGRRTSS